MTSTFIAPIVCALISPCLLFLLTPAQALGTILNWTLYGVLITQFCKSLIKSFVVLPVRSSYGKDIYTYSFPDDGRCFKYLGMFVYSRYFESFTALP